MRIVKVESKFNSFNIEELTEGKLLAIKHALEFQQHNNCITIIGEEILITLTRFLEKLERGNNNG